MDELATLTGMVAVSRRYVSADDLVELLTQQVATARDLVGLVRYRLQQLLNQARRRARIDADELGGRYAAQQAARAAFARELHEQTGQQRAATRSALDQALARKTARVQAAAAAEAERRAAKRAELGLTQPPAVAERDRAAAAAEDCPCQDCRMATRPPVVDAGDLHWLGQQTTPARRQPPRLLGSRDPNPVEALRDMADWSRPRDRRR